MIQGYSPKTSFVSTPLLLLLFFYGFIFTVLNTHQAAANPVDYVQGKIYVEIKARYQNMNWEYNQELLKPKHHGLRRWILQYQITKIEKLGTRNAYHFHFKKAHLTEAFLQTLADLPYIKKATQIPIPIAISKDENSAPPTIDTFHKPNLVLIPTAFSPNKDGSNDYFQIKGQNLYSYELQIFNRLGEPICKVNETDVYGWNGNINGRAVPSGIYAYYGWVRFEDGETKVLKGYLTLMK